MSPPHTHNDDSSELPTKFKWLERVLDRWGAPTVLLMVFAGFFFGGLYWFANRIATPLVGEHVKFLDQEIETSRGVIITQKAIGEAVQKLADAREKLAINSARQIEILDTMQAQMRTDHTQQAIDHKAAVEKMEGIESKVKKP